MQKLVWSGALACLVNGCSTSTTNVIESRPSGGQGGGQGGGTSVVAAGAGSSLAAGASGMAQDPTPNGGLANAGRSVGAPSETAGVADIGVVLFGGVRGVSGANGGSSAPSSGQTSSSAGGVVAAAGGLAGVGGSGRAGAGTTSGSSGRGGAVVTAAGRADQGGAQQIGGIAGTTVGGSPVAECLGLLEKFHFSDPLESCSVSATPAKLVRTNIMFVIDKSASMRQNRFGSSQSKWQSVTESISAMLDPTDTRFAYGLVLFPYLDSATQAALCEVNAGAAAVNVPIGSAAETAAQIIALMAAPSSAPSGGTPTGAALDAALVYYESVKGRAVVGPKYVVLVTDGGPNCNASGPSCDANRCTTDIERVGSCGTTVTNCCDPKNVSATVPTPNALCLDDQTVLGKISQLSAEGIQTAVVGLGGSEAYASYFDAFAIAGGIVATGGLHKYYADDVQGGLVETLKSVFASLSWGCSAQLQEVPADPRKLNVAIDCVPIAAKSSTGTVNWSYDAATNTVLFQGAVCERIRNSNVQRIDLVNGCATRESI